MTKFIMLTFGFLGWAFYEMSDGPDFQPASVVVTQHPLMKSTSTAENAPAEQPASVAKTLKVAKSVPVDTTPPGFESAADEAAPIQANLSKVSLNLTTLKQASAKVASYAPTNASFVQVASNVQSQNATQQAIIPSLIEPNNSRTAANLVNASTDIRAVAGSRVNVRGGPGTGFQVVTKLGLGDSVEIIQDNGDGWVKMRPLDGGPEGWMADFLLSSS